MNVLFLFITYPKDPNESNLTKDLSDEFSKKNNSVYIATVSEKSLNEDTNLTSKGNVNVLRVKIGNLFNNISKFEKLFSMVTLNNKLLVQIQKHWGDIDFDLIVGTTPYTCNYKLIKGLKKHFDAPAFLILWDIFPQNAKDLNLIKNTYILKYFEKIEKKNLLSFDFIGCQSLGNLKYMKNNYEYLDQNKLSLFPQWSNNRKNPIFDKASMRDRYGFLPDDFILVFGGNMGKPQNLENIISLAKESSLHQEIKFLLVGKGTESNALKTLVKNSLLENVVFIDALPRDDYELLIASCDVGLVSLDPRFTFPNCPSKILSYLKYGLPILGSVDKYALADYGKLIESEIKAGLFCEASNIQQFKKNLLDMFHNKELRRNMSENGIKYFQENFSVENRYLDILASVSKSKDIS